MALRSSVRLLQRSAGALLNDGARLLSSDSASLLSNLQGARNENQGVISSSQMRIPSMMNSFAIQGLHSLSSASNDEENKTASSSSQQTIVPSTLAALPPKPVRPSSALAHRYMGTAAAHADPHDDAHHHGPYWNAHPFHVLPPSPWPILAGCGAGVACLGMSAFFHAIPGGLPLMLSAMGSIAVTATAWWRDCIIESDMGMHTEVVKKNLISGVWLFIVSEAVLFFGLLWSCVHLGMAPNVHVQMQWPPVGIEAVGWDKRALVMSAVLAASYYSANVAMVAKDQKTVMAALGVTLGLGVLFLGDQYLEYSNAPFTITDGPYGTTFFTTTGFHGMHVFLGAIWLATSMAMYPRYKNPGVGMRGAILYWHFVDIVWIAVYGIIYVAQL